MLVVVQVVAIGNQPSRPLSQYKLQELIERTNKYRNRARVKRQAGESVYIAANLTESELATGFTLGDGGTYSGYVNHPLDPGVGYAVGLWSQVSGTDTPVLNSATQPICKSGCLDFTRFSQASSLSLSLSLSLSPHSPSPAHDVCPLPFFFGALFLFSPHTSRS